MLLSHYDDVGAGVGQQNWVLVQSWALQPNSRRFNPDSATPWLVSLGQTQEKQPKNSAAETQRSKLTEEREMDHSREGNFYPWLAECNAGRAAPRLSPAQPGCPRTSLQVSPQPPPKTAQRTHKSNSSSLIWRCRG